MCGCIIRHGERPRKAWRTAKLPVIWKRALVLQYSQTILGPLCPQVPFPLMLTFIPKTMIRSLPTSILRSTSLSHFPPTTPSRVFPSPLLSSPLSSHGTTTQYRCWGSNHHHHLLLLLLLLFFFGCEDFIRNPREKRRKKWWQE